MRFGRAVSVVRVAGILVSLSMLAQELKLRSTPDQIQVTAPALHFLTGKPLDRLKSGVSIPFDFQLSLLTDSKNTILRQDVQRFVISYDIWEEKFSVTRLRGVKASAARLTAASTEQWCLDNLSVSASGIPKDKLLWVRLDIRAQEARSDRPLSEEDGLSLASLIEVFSRPVRPDGKHWRLETGPVRLQDLLKSGRIGF